MQLDNDSYDAGYKQALQDVCAFIEHMPTPEIQDTEHMKDFWSILTRARDTSTNRFHMFIAGYKIAKRELCNSIESLADKI